jgi:hypothetical protein
MALFDLLYRSRRKISRIPVPVIQVYVLKKTAWVQGVGQFLVLFEFGRSPILARRYCPRGQVYANSNARGIHDFYSPGEALGGAINVLVKVNNKVLCAPKCRQSSHRLFRGESSSQRRTTDQQSDRNEYSHNTGALGITLVGVRSSIN